MAKHNRRTADLLKPRPHYPQLLGVPWIDRYRLRNLAKSVVNQRQSRFMLLDRCLTLSLEARIDQRELPSRRRPLRHNPILPAVKVEVLALIANVLQGCQPRSDPEIHMGQITVLRRMKPYRDRGGIPFANLEILVAHRRIERSGIGIGYRWVGGDRSHNRLWWPAGGKIEPRILARFSSGKEKHVTQSLLIAWRIIRQHKHRSSLPISDHPDRRPHINRSRHPVSPRGHKHNSFAMLRRPVDRRLNGRAVVAQPVAVHRKAVRRQINCLRIFEPHRIVRHRLRRHRGANWHSNQQEEPNPGPIHRPSAPRVLQPSARPRDMASKELFGEYSNLLHFDPTSSRKAYTEMHCAAGDAFCSKFRADVERPDHRLQMPSHR